MVPSTDDTGPPFPIVAVLDANGAITWVSEGWRQFDSSVDATSGNRAASDTPAQPTRTETAASTDQVAAAVHDRLDADDSPSVGGDLDHVHDGDGWVRLSVTTARIAGETRRLVVYRQLSNDEADEPPTNGRFPTNVHVQPSNPLVTYKIGPKETAIDGLLAAFDAIGIDVQSRETTLHDYLATDPINSMFRKNEEFHLTFSVWDHAVTLTPDELTIYDTDPE